jgi:hypothetical protein
MTAHHVQSLNGFMHLLEMLSIQSGGITILQRFEMLIEDFPVRYAQTTQQENGVECGICLIVAMQTEVMPPTDEKIKDAKPSYKHFMKNNARGKILEDIVLRGVFNIGVELNEDTRGKFYFADRECSFCGKSDQDVKVISDCYFFSKFIVCFSSQHHRIIYAFVYRYAQTSTLMKRVQ